MMDISNFYLMTPLKRPEYIRMKMSDIPQEIIEEYKLKDMMDPLSSWPFVECMASRKQDF